MDSKTYKAQILLEVEMVGASNHFEAEDKARSLTERLEVLGVSVLNTHIITEPSDTEFLKEFGICL